METATATAAAAAIAATLIGDREVAICSDGNRCNFDANSFGHFEADSLG